MAIEHAAVPSTIGVLPKEEVPSTLTGSWWQPPALSAFEIVSCFGIDCERSLFDLGTRLVPLRNYLAAHSDSEFLVTNRACPVGDGMVRNVVIVSRRVLPAGDDPVFDRVWTKYKEGDAALRDKWIKYLPRLKSAAPCSQGSLSPWLWSKALYFSNVVGGHRPVTMGSRYVTQQHSTGPNYVEVDVDIQSSAFTGKVASRLLAYSSVFTINESFVVDLKEETGEVQERMLCQIQFKHVDTAQMAEPLPEEDYISESNDDVGASAAAAEALREAHTPSDLQVLLIVLCLLLSIRLGSSWVAVFGMLVLHPALPRLALTSRSAAVVTCFGSLLGSGVWMLQQVQWCGVLLFIGLLWLKAYGLTGLEPPFSSAKLTPLKLSSILRSPRDENEGSLCESTCCCICLEPYSDTDSPVCLRACAHAFHRLCLERWVRRHPTCPVCRRNLTV